MLNCLNRHGQTLVNKKLLIEQLSFIKSIREIDCIERYSDSKAFWDYYCRFGYVQFAAFAYMLVSVKAGKTRTIENNFVAMNVLS